ncbi:CYTH and CHAD domain-containing protein [Streptacidiphilus rugosus]|uniref:CYTH and CHAD domain-containing protein n=1 Tax=Streptacidiphilus rugosus TaxID=405783 RepID=UPI000A61AD63|nr:CYTH and CHAD domain-containing protein [Streptacidiphilus rugosus]
MPGRKSAAPTPPVAHLERERKYESDAPGTPHVPVGADQLPGVARAVAAPAERLDAVYHDTPDRRLLARRITLRRRTGGHDAGWHLKLPTADGARLELRLPLGDEGPGSSATQNCAVPEELVTRVRAYVRDAPLAPVARLRTERRRTLLEDEGGRTLAELADDTVTAETLDPSGAVLTSVSWNEVEAELVEGDTDLLDALERQLLAAGLRRSGSGSKLARALGEPPRQERSTLTPGSIGALLGALLRQQVDQLLALDAEVRGNAPDSVHQMRITARRLRSTLRVHERLLRLPAVAGLEEELRWLGHTLGAARDREVLGERLLAELAELPAEERPGPMRRRLGAWSRRGYAAAWRRAAKELDGPRYFALLDALDAVADRPPLRKRASRPATTEVPRLLTREQRRACGRVAHALALPPGHERDEAMHAARRASKRARYAGEGAAQPRFAGAMKAVQALLGERQDALLAAEALPAIAAAATAAGESSFGYGVLYAHERAAVAAAEAQVPERHAAALAVRVK